MLDRLPKPNLVVAPTKKMLYSQFLIFGITPMRLVPSPPHIIVIYSSNLETAIRVDDTLELGPMVLTDSVATLSVHIGSVLFFLRKHSTTAPGYSTTSVRCKVTTLKIPENMKDLHYDDRRFMGV